MTDYGYTTVGIKPEYRDLINELADYHGLKTNEFLPMLILAYAFASPQGRETMLDIGSKILYHASKGMKLSFDDSLTVSDECLEDIVNVQSNETSD